MMVLYQSVYLAYRIRWLVFLLAAELRVILDFGRTLVEIGLMYLLVLYTVSVKMIYRISSNKLWASNKRRRLISAAPFGIHIEISASL